MAAEGKIDFVMLWEEELRLAAKLFDDYHALPDDASEEDEQQAALAAFHAADAALNGLKPDTSVVMLSNRTVKAAATESDP